MLTLLIITKLSLSGQPLQKNRNLSQRQIYVDAYIKKIKLLRQSDHSSMDLHQDNESSKGHIQFMVELTEKISGFLNNLNVFIFDSLQKFQRDQSFEQDQINDSTIKGLSNVMDYRLARAKGRRLKIQSQEERPKGPTSSFLIYYHDNKRQLAKKYGSANVSTLTKVASREWKRLPQQERDKYQRLSEQSKVRYQKQMQQYKQKYAEEIERALKQRRVEYRANWMRKKQLKQALQRGQIVKSYRGQAVETQRVKANSQSESSSGQQSL